MSKKEWKKSLKEDYAFMKDWLEARKNSYQSQFARKIGARIVELIQRDPLSKELTKTIKENLSAFKVIRAILPPELFPPDLFDRREIMIDDQYLTNNFDPDIPKHIKNTADELGRKWYCEIETTIHNPLNKEKSLTFELFHVDDLWAVKFNILSPVEIPIMPVGNNWPLNDCRFNLNRPFEASSPMDKLPIFINLSVIDNSDLTLIRNIVGETVKARLKEFRNSQHEEPSKGFLPVFRDKYLMFLYHTKEKTFQNYLRWYDHHTQEKLSFRLLAHIEETRRKNVKKASECLDEFIHKRVKWGKPVKGEDKIEKGVKLIYNAIYRKPYDRKAIEPPFENYDCPCHGNKCPPDCWYKKEWEGRFNRLFPANGDFTPYPLSDPLKETRKRLLEGLPDEDFDPDQSIDDDYNNDI